MRSLPFLRHFPAGMPSVLGRRRLAGAIVPRLAPAIYAAARFRRLVSRPSPVVAVVGSFGKTTTTRAIRVALGLPPDSQRGTSVAFAGLHMALHARRGAPLVLEAGIQRPGTMAPAAAALKPDAVVVTSIGHEHLLTFHTLEALRAEKAKMVRALSRNGLAFLNGDDPHVRWMHAQTTRPVTTFGFGPECAVRADEPVLDWPHGMVTAVHMNGTTTSLRLRLIGRHNIYPVLAALAVATAYGVRLEDAIGQLESLTPASGRLELVRSASGAWILRDDFKSSWESMTAAITTLAQLPARRRIVVLGDINEPPSPQRQFYRTLGRHVGEAADRFIVVGEQYLAYKRGALEAGMPAADILDAGRSLHRATSLLPSDLGEGDVVLVKGRQIQRLERIALQLAGRVVGCRLVACRTPLTSCATCPMLEQGWPDGHTTDA